MSLILAPLAVVVAVIAVAYPFVAIVDLIGIALVFGPEESRKNELANFRQENQLAGYSDWQIIGLLILLAINPYFNLSLFSSALAVTNAKITEWLEPFGKKKG